MRYDLVVSDGLLVTPDGTARGSLGITGGRIAAISEDHLDGQEVVDARERVVLPGAVDLHAHFNEPGRTHWEGWDHGSRAAAAGGVTTVVEMPLNAIPPTTSAVALQEKVSAAQRSSVVDFALWGGLVNDNLDQLEGLARAGVMGFKAFMTETGTSEFTHVTEDVLAAGLRRLADLGQFLAVHAESDILVKTHTQRVRDQGPKDRSAWGQSRPPLVELEAVRQAIALAGEARCPLHIVHMSLPEGVAAVRRGRAGGQAVTVETCPHYLTLTDDDLIRLGPVAKCAPPLRNRARVEGLWSALLRGEIDCVTSDHSPCPTEDKTRGDDDIFLAWGGISGIQTMLPLMLTEGVHRRGLPLDRLAGLIAAAPAKIAGLFPRKGAIQVGADADLVLIDLDREWQLERSWLRSRHPHSPFIGWQMKGWIGRVLRRGQTIAIDGEVAATGGGAWLQRSSAA